MTDTKVKLRRVDGLIRVSISFSCVFNKVTYHVVMSYLSAKETMIVLNLNKRDKQDSKAFIEEYLKKTLNGVRPWGCISPGLDIHHVRRAISSSKKFTEYLIRQVWNRFPRGSNGDYELAFSDKSISVELTGRAVADCMWLTDTNITRQKQVKAHLSRSGMYPSDEVVVASNEEKFKVFTQALVTIYTGSIFETPLKLWLRLVNEMSQIENLCLIVRLTDDTIQIRFDSPNFVAIEGAQLARIMDVHEADKVHPFINFLIGYVQYIPRIAFRGWFHGNDTLNFPHHQLYYQTVVD